MIHVRLVGGLDGGDVQFPRKMSPTAYLCFSITIFGSPSGRSATKGKTLNNRRFQLAPITFFILNSRTLLNFHFIHQRNNLNMSQCIAQINILPTKKISLLQIKNYSFLHNVIPEDFITETRLKIHLKRMSRVNSFDRASKQLQEPRGKLNVIKLIPSCLL